MKLNKILIVGGTHGNEPLGIKLVELLSKTPIEGVDTIIGNPKAVKANKRFIQSDLNRSFGDSYKDTYESSLAKKLETKTKRYDIVIDLHNTQTPNNNCVFVGVGCKQVLLNVAKVLNFKQCIEATYDCINKYCLNTISIEISLGDKLDDADYWYTQIQKLKQSNTKSNKKLTIYKFKQRVTWQQKEEFNIQNWKPFCNISKQDKLCLSLSGIIVPIFIDSKLTEYYATLLTKERTV